MHKRETQATSFMDAALAEARAAQAAGEVPIGCVVVRDGAIVARAGNRTVRDYDPTAHAELLAIRAEKNFLFSNGCSVELQLHPRALTAQSL